METLRPETLGTSTSLAHQDTKLKVICWDMYHVLRCQVGNPVLTRALISQVLLGLDEDYNAVAVALQGKTELSWLQMKSKLVSYEKSHHKVKVGKITFAMEIVVVVVDNPKVEDTAEDDIIQHAKFMEK
ncbi:Retrovirus-related Pol polyprotein from transposon TNT 1-94 [Cucumis melo var. makuwa]|uniref:Retrovirus-related Pol polyprotein from transposon TNT 1-94 n=1 Tax=Cucumis melo var. makuwa TaxID=1194695 RepID=A0A5D3BAL3_CUCMM|nr:Retrovirus-related Pol polyprotein from transposon TNT 1-94 [Cucumis melo var. makuwa]TYJ95936.1 Retrovirus-related Pol polyprotein from transposon TNT 1-94 [Cucumis melo var. makuwa]